jgi:hypothetical protein
MRHINKIIEKIAEFEKNNKRAGSKYSIKRIELKDVFYVKLIHELESISSDTRTILVAKMIQFLLDENLMNNEKNYSSKLKNEKDITVVVQQGLL